MYCRAVKKVSLCKYYFWDNPTPYQVTLIYYKKYIEPVIYTMTTKTKNFMFLNTISSKNEYDLFLHGYNT